MTSTTAQPTPVPTAWVLVGHYFRILAFVSLLEALGLLIQGKGLTLDLSFFLFFWLGRGVLEGGLWPRRIALALCGFQIVGALISLGSSAATHWGMELPWEHPTNTFLFEILQCSSVLLLVLPAMLLLLRPLLIPETARDPDPAHPWSQERLTLYFLGSLLLGALGAGRELLTGTVTLKRTFGSLGFAQGAPSMEVLTRAEFDGKTAHFVSSFALGETNKVGSDSSDSPTVRLCSTLVRLPDIRPGHYVKFLESPREPVNQPNIVLVRADGSILRVQRRVTLADLASLHAALRGSKDVEDAQQRIESLLPPMKGPVPPDKHP